MSIISEISNLNCLYEPVTPEGDDNCTIITTPTVSVSGTLERPQLKNLGGNASTDNSSSINNSSPTFEFVGKIQEIGDGSFSLPSIIKFNGKTYFKNNGNSKKYNIFFRNVRRWDNSEDDPMPVPGPMPVLDPMPVPGPIPVPEELDPVSSREYISTVYAASEGIGKIIVNYRSDCVGCTESAPIDSTIVYPSCPPGCPKTLIMADINGTFAKN